MPINMHWQDIIVPFASAFAGAYFAYKFNTCSENKKHDEENFKQFNVLLNQINVVWMALLNYKIVYLSEIEKLINTNPQKAVKKTIYPPNVIFKANVEQNIFLAKYNFYFLLLLSEIEKHTLLTQEAINLCQKQFSENANLEQLSEDTIKTGLETFQLTKDFVDKSISYLILLREKLLKCKNLYFKFLYLDERDIRMDQHFVYLLPNINSFTEISNLSKIIEDSWIKSFNLFDYIKLYNEKLCFKVSSFFTFIGIKK